MSLKRYTAIWQSATPHEFEWIDEIFGPYIKEHVYDAEHRVVLDDAILFDAFINRYDPAYYESFRGRNAFLVHFLDESYRGGYERYLNFKGVFRKHWSDFFNGEGVFPIPLGYCNGFRRQGALTPASERSYAWSFAGAAAKSSRPDAISALSAIAPHRVIATDGFELKGLEIERTALGPGESAALLRESVFAPAPMGNVNLECFRIYEALEAGSIPILEKRLTLDYYTSLLGAHPLPIFRTWRQAARYVNEIRFDPARLDALQERCVEWWDGHKRQLVGSIGDFLAERSARSPDNFYSDRAASPFWQHIELLRHQNATALTWRVRRQAVRLLKSGRYRVS